MGTRDDDLDLLTAALIGLTVGVGVTLLLRRGPGGRRPLVAGVELAGRGASLAGAAGVGSVRDATRLVRRGRRRGLKRGSELLDHVPDLHEVGDQLAGFIEAAKGAVEDTVSGELQDLRKAIRRRRRRLGL